MAIRSSVWALLWLTLAGCGGARTSAANDLGVGAATSDLAGGAAAGGDLAPPPGADLSPARGRTLVFQCDGLGGGICLMNLDGSGRQLLEPTGRMPDRDDAGEILFHDDNYHVQKRAPGGGLTDLGAGAFARWSNGGIVFQCDGLGGGVCTMDADGGNRRTLEAKGRVPDRDDAGEILFHDDNYHVQKRAPGGGVTDLGAGAFARWSNGGIVFQCDGLGGGICTMDADGGNRRTLEAKGRVPDRDDAGEILFHDDNYHVQERAPGGGVTDLGAGAFARFAP